MAQRNLFTPAFGGLPQVFFGRQKELRFATDALENESSPYRAFFITGNRGCGKTTLLERISKTAELQSWLTIDVHSTHASQAVLETLAGGTEKTTGKTISPSAFGVSAGGVTSATTHAYSEASLGQLLIDRARSLVAHRGLLITVDEVQKVPEQDAENLCASLQLALRKGLPVMLVLAGLPGSKEKVASYPGCTFMQRAYDMRIEGLEVDETLDAFKQTFVQMPELVLSDGAAWEMGVFSQGYPYLMQLIGYYVVERAHGRQFGGPTPVDVDDVRAVEPLALAAYRENVLVPILSSLSDGMSAYLEAACDAEDDQGRIATGGIAELLGKNSTQISSYRQRLIDRRLIEPDGRGFIRFSLPHMREYYQSELASLERRDPSQNWRYYRG